MVKYRTVCLCLMILVAGVSNGQGIHSDVYDSNQFDIISSMEETVLQDDEVPSAFLFGTSSSSSLSPPFIDTSLTGICKNTAAIVCTGCRRVRVCFPGISDQSLLPEYDCPAGTYCNTIGKEGGGACLTNVDDQFPECRYTTGIVEGGDTVGSLCTGLGLFPDPQDCRKFHYCTIIGGYTRPLRCPSGYVYNSKKQTCSRNTRCQTIQCRPNRRSIFIPFPQDPTYYAYCYYNRQGPRNRPVLKNVVMYKCAAGSEFNSLSNSCVFKCSREGFFPKIGDPAKFYWCRKVRGKLFGYEQVCPGVGSLFSPRLGICLPPPTTTTTTAMETSTSTLPMTSTTSSTTMETTPTTSESSTSLVTMETTSTMSESTTFSTITDTTSSTSDSTTSLATTDIASTTSESSASSTTAGNTPTTSESSTSSVTMETTSTMSESTTFSSITDSTSSASDSTTSLATTDTASTTSESSAFSTTPEVITTTAPVGLDEMFRLPPWPLWAPVPVSF